MDLNGVFNMLRLTGAQSTTLKQMHCTYIVTQLDTGALVAVFEQVCHTWMVITPNGKIYSFSHYFPVAHPRPIGRACGQH